MKAATTRFGLLALAMALSACAALEGDKIDYKSAAKGSTLEVPPDLTQLSRDSRYTIPGGGPVSAAAMQAGQAAQRPEGVQVAPQRRDAGCTQCGNALGAGRQREDAGAPCTPLSAQGPCGAQTHVAATDDEDALAPKPRRKRAEGVLV